MTATAIPERVTLTFSTNDLVALTDASYRQIDYWCRIGLLAPYVAASGSGSQRRFDETELRVVAVVTALSALGCPLHSVATRAARTMRRLGVPDGGLLYVSLEGDVGPEPRAGLGWVVDLDELEFAERRDLFRWDGDAGGRVLAVRVRVRPVRRPARLLTRAAVGTRYRHTFPRLLEAACARLWP